MKEAVIVPAVERALDVIEYMASEASEKTLKTMADDLAIPSASLFRIIKNLTARGYLLQVEGHPPKYMLGHKISQLSAAYVDKYTIKNMVKPYMERLAQETNQTAQFVVRRGDEFIYIEQVLSGAPVNFIARLYVPMAINTSAGAKCILAQLTEEEQENFLMHEELEKKTDRTIVDKEALLEELVETKKRGYGMDDEEFSQGIGCIAVPVFCGGAECVGAMGITGKINDYRDPDKFEQLKEILMRMGEEVSLRLN